MNKQQKNNKNNNNNEIFHTKHSPDYNQSVPQEIFNIEDSDEITEA